MRQFLIIAGLLLLLTTIGALGIHALTDTSWLESWYIAVVTLATVGSRDVPNEAPVMIFVMLYLIGGLGVFTYSAFQIGHILVNADIRKMLERRHMERELSKLDQHYIVCGLGRMGMSICEYLAARRQPFVIIDREENEIGEICRDRRWHLIAGDATDDEVLRRAGIERAKSLATVLSTDADNVYVVLSARLLSFSLQIVARASDHGAVQKLQRAGATRVISPFSSGGVKMARFMLSPRIEDFLEFTDERGSDLELVEVQIDANNPYVSKTLAETDLREQGIMVIGIRRASGEQIIAPAGSVRLQPGDSLFAFGRSNAVSAMAENGRTP